MEKRFEYAKSMAMTANKGIGTLGEKTLHSFLKYYIEPDETRHEIKLGRYVADIVNEDGVTEIQTRSFNAMRAKLSAFLPEHKVTLVHPLAAVKRLCWIDPETGDISKSRTSPKKASVHDAFLELYKIKSFLTQPNLHIKFILLELTEYRNLDGWSGDRKKGSTRFDRVPTAVLDEICINSTDDYRRILPDGLPEKFTSKDYSRCARVNLRRAQTALNVLKYVGAVQECGKNGNAILYKTTLHTSR